MLVVLALLAQNVPTSQYEPRTLEGWSVKVNKDLGDSAALALLEEKLREVARLVPAGPLAKLREGQVWRQESVVGSVFEASGRIVDGRVRPTIVGSAHVTAEATLILGSDDPFVDGIRGEC